MSILIVWRNLKKIFGAKNTKIKNNIQKFKMRFLINSYFFTSQPIRNYSGGKTFEMIIII